MKTVAIIPCLNEQEHIIEVVTGAKEFVDVVVVADNGSSDQTITYARQAGAKISPCNSKGLGNNLYYGLCVVVKQYSPDIIVLLDGDGQHDTSDIPALLKPIQKGLADVVIGDRYQSPFIRSMGIRLLTWVFNIGHPIKVNDPMIGFWAIKSSALTIPTNPGWGCYIEMLENARRKHKRIMSVPVTVKYFDKYSDNSSKPALWLGLNLLWNIIRYRFGSIK